MIRFLITLFFCSALPAVGMVEYSDLWGQSGEKWTPQGRLPDFSYAGYHSGEKAIPKIKTVTNVKDFGAAGDGVHDDSQAFIDAIAATENGAIEIPPGRYKITRIIEIRKSNIVLRGAGFNKTTLFFPIPLETIKPNPGSTTSGRPTSNYSWSGGLIWVQGDYGSDELCRITKPAKRGDTLLVVSSTKKLRPGQEVEFYQRDTKDNTLAADLYSNDAGDTEKLLGRVTTSQPLKIGSIKGNKVFIDRPLRFDCKDQWRPILRRFEPTVAEVGIEYLCFEFPKSEYKGHFTESGFNALTFRKVANCWARDIKIKNCDSGMFLSSSFCTLSGIIFESQRGHDKQQCTGHHGITLAGCDNLLTGFDYRTRFIHDITVTNSSYGNVSSNGKGIDICFDHHKRAPCENLFCNIDIGAGTRIWKCGGGASLGKNSASRETFWNIRADRDQDFPPEKFCPDMVNLVALQTNKPSIKDSDGKWFEAIAPNNIIPQDIHAAQLQKRLNTTKK